MLGSSLTHLPRLRTGAANSSGDLGCMASSLHQAMCQPPFVRNTLRPEKAVAHMMARRPVSEIASGVEFCPRGLELYKSGVAGWWYTSLASPPLSYATVHQHRSFHRQYEALPRPRRAPTASHQRPHNRPARPVRLATSIPCPLHH